VGVKAKGVFVRQRSKEWKLKREVKRRLRKGEPLTARNSYGVLDLTPYNAVRLLRGEPDKTIYG
jgi:hypothetical protein